MGDSMNRPTEKPTLPACNYAIIAAALQAKRELLERSLNAREIRRHLTLVRLGRQVVAQLQREGVHLPEIDLADPQSSPAAPAAHVENGQARRRTSSSDCSPVNPWERASCAPASGWCCRKSERGWTGYPMWAFASSRCRSSLRGWVRSPCEPSP